jgi:broad specificity phosphatase PhoE
MDLWLARHGETAWNHARRFQGARDVELSTRGREQAARLADGLADRRFDALYTSPLARCRETAAACAARLDLVPEVVDDLREVGLGEWEGLTVDAVVASDREAYWRWLTAPGHNPPPGGERMDDLQRRVTGAIAAIEVRHPGGAVLLVSHGGAIATFLCGRLALGLDAVWRLRIENTAVCRIELPAARLLRLNDTRHLAQRTPAPVPVTAP